MKPPATQSGAYKLGVILALGSLGLSACTCLTQGQAEFDVGIKQRGHASWYGEYFHGLQTANGEIYDMHAMTAAHRTLPLGTVVKVFNIVNGEQVVVKINDRGPYKKGRIVDLSYAAVKELDMVDRGIAPVHLEVVGDQRPGVPALYGKREAISAPLEGGTPYSQLVMNLGYARDEWSSKFPATILSNRSRPRPADLLRAPRIRRVADVLEADHDVYSRATGLVVT